jgi:hypothetical protein
VVAVLAMFESIAAARTSLPLPNKTNVEQNPMSTPWRELKDAEIAMLLDRRRGIASSEEAWKRLNDLFDSCSEVVDAQESVCWQGVAAMMAERDGHFVKALEHRRIEIEMILWLQAEEVRNPTNGYQTQDYGESDLAFRREIVAVLEDKIQSSG